MQPFWSGTARDFIDTPDQMILGALARQQLRHFRASEPEQDPVWHETVAALRTALRDPALSGAHLALEYPMLRLGMRIDAVLLTDRAILVLEFKRTAADPGALRHVEDYALNLRDFHDASRTHPIVPVLVSSGAEASRNTPPLFWHGYHRFSRRRPMLWAPACTTFSSASANPTTRSTPRTGSPVPTVQSRPSSRPHAWPMRGTAWPRSPPHAPTSKT